MYSSLITIISINCSWNSIKTVRAVDSWNRNIGNFAKCTEWPQTELKESGMKSTLRLYLQGRRGPNFHQFRSTICRFQDMHILGFSHWLNVKISKCYKRFNFSQIAKTFVTLYSLMAALVIIKLGSDRITIVGGVAFWNLQPHMPYGPVLTKNSKCHKVFNFWQIAKSFITLYSPMTILFIITLGVG